MKKISEHLIQRLAKELKNGPIFIPGNDDDYVRKLAGELKKYLHLAISSKKGTSYEPFQPTMDDFKVPTPKAETGGAIRKGHFLSIEEKE